jgi:hypothetical protein
MAVETHGDLVHTQTEKAKIGLCEAEQQINKPHLFESGHSAWGN